MNIHIAFPKHAPLIDAYQCEYCFSFTAFFELFYSAKEGAKCILCCRKDGTSVDKLPIINPTTEAFASDVMNILRPFGVVVTPPPEYARWAILLEYSEEANVEQVVKAAIIKFRIDYPQLHCPRYASRERMSDGSACVLLYDLKSPRETKDTFKVVRPFVKQYQNEH